MDSFLDPSMNVNGSDSSTATFDIGTVVQSIGDSARTIAQGVNDVNNARASVTLNSINNAQMIQAAQSRSQVNAGTGLAVLVLVLVVGSVLEKAA
jgi:hypothetical protein